MKTIKCKFFMLLCLSLVMGLSACGFDDLGSGSSNSVNLKRNKPLDTSADVMNSKLAPPKGFVNKNLFSESLNDTDDRLDRLEEVVQNLHDNLSVHMPAIKNLSEIDGEIQELIEQLETLVNEPAPAVMAQPVSPVSQALSATPTMNAKATPTPITNKDKVAPVSQSPSPSTGTVIENIRVSQNGNKTRIVFDSNKKINYRIDYDAQEALVLVSADEASVSANLASVARKSSKINAVEQSRNGNALNLIFGLKGSAQVGKGTLLSPNKDSRKYRYFFDITG